MSAYIVPDWMTVIAGAVIFSPSDRRVLMGLRSAREGAGMWSLPTGLGAIRRDISEALAAKAPVSLENPQEIIQTLSERHQVAFQGPAGFALAETRWYVYVPPSVKPEDLVPLEPIGQVGRDKALFKLYFGLEWQKDQWGEPRPAEGTGWPFTQVRFFSREELQEVPIAFDCDKDLDAVFWWAVGERSRSKEKEEKERRKRRKKGERDERPGAEEKVRTGVIAGPGWVSQSGTTPKKARGGFEKGRGGRRDLPDEGR